MNANSLLNEIASWGYPLKPLEFTNYLSRMIKRERAIFILNDDGLQAILFYFLIENVDDLLSFTNKPTWATPPDSRLGPIFFVDKMLCRKWTREVRETIRLQVEARYPEVEYALWLRRPQNRHVILKRRSATHGIQG